MSTKEVAKYIRSEVEKHQKRIATKAKEVARKMLKAHKKVHTYQQKLGSETEITIYIYGIDEKGIDFAAGCWFYLKDELCWVTPGAIGVQFFKAHFFQRYAERYLKKKLTVRDTALEFYREYQNSATQLTRDLGKGIFKAQTPLHDGLALGICDKVNDYVLNRTFVSKDDLFRDQVEDIEADAELNKEIQSLDSLQYKLVLEQVMMNK